MTSFSGSEDHWVIVRKSSRPAKKQNVNSTDGKAGARMQNKTEDAVLQLLL